MKFDRDFMKNEADPDWQTIKWPVIVDYFGRVV